MTLLAGGLVLALGIAAVFLAQDFLESQKTVASLAPEAAKPAVPMHTVVVATQPQNDQTGQELRGHQASDAGALPIDPSARVSVIRGMARHEYRIPKQLPDIPDTRCAAIYASLCYDGDGTLLR